MLFRLPLTFALRSDRVNKPGAVSFFLIFASLYPYGECYGTERKHLVGVACTNRGCCYKTARTFSKFHEYSPREIIVIFSAFSGDNTSCHIPIAIVDRVLPILTATSTWNRIGVNVIHTASASVRAQLRLVFAIVIAISFLSAGLAIWRLQALSKDTHALTEQPLVKERLISSWLLNISVAAKRTAVVARSSDQDLAHFFAQDAKESSARSSDLQKKIGELTQAPEERALFDEIVQLRKLYVSDRDRVMQLKTEGKAEEALAHFDREFTPHTEQYVSKVQQLLAMQQKSIDERAQSVLSTADLSQKVLITLSLVTVAVSMVASALFSRALFRRLGGEPAQAAAVATEIAAGNLRVQINVAAGDDSSLMAAMQRMRDSLGTMVAQVRDSTTAIGESAYTIASEAQDLSGRTERQAAALEETASSMEELTQTVAHNNDSAQNASELAAQATNVARKGGDMVGKLVSTMGLIDESSKRIVDIISVIDSIAFQTNILALNAAVEAARAGEQGRGFAVVASEVRALAHRSAAAAKEIKELIEDSTRRVESGTTLARQVGTTMTGVVAGIERVTSIMGDIVESSREQSTGIVQVNQTISQMDQSTQQNAALVEEAAAATDILRQQAETLAELMSAFQIGSAAVHGPGTWPKKAAAGNRDATLGLMPVS
jgi:methyl-accepting chemotaxis protein